MASLLPALAFLAGLAAIVTGLGFIYWPAAPIAAGTILCAGALGYERRPKKPAQGSTT